MTSALVEYAQPRPGMKVLDLASGTGEPAISLALAVGEQGHVTALDLSADLLQIAEKRALARRSTTLRKTLPWAWSCGRSVGAGQKSSKRQLPYFAWELMVRLRTT